MREAAEAGVEQLRTAEWKEENAAALDRFQV